MVNGDKRKVLIVGAGCFGLSTAYHLLKRGFTDVTVIDRSEDLPAPDAASCDLNKIVRTSYSDIFYTRLACDAIRCWRDEKEWGDAFHGSGVLLVAPQNDWGETKSKFDNDVALGVRCTKFEDEDAMRSRSFPPGVRAAPFTGQSGYLNHDAGWANASQGIFTMIKKVIAMGGQVLSGKSVIELLRRKGKISGVKCSGGDVFDADIVILAAGAWTAASFPDLDLGNQCLATGQSIATIQLTSDEALIYRKCPVVLNFTTGFYVFPPNKDSIVKLGTDTAGYTNTSTCKETPVSAPRTVLSHAEDGLRIPKVMVQSLRNHLGEVYPDLAEKPFAGTRLCWYTDTPDEDWVIGRHPSDPCLYLATGGSGHAYKFLPVIGRLVADAVQGILDPLLETKFAVNRTAGHINTSRAASKAQELDVEQLCLPEDLLPTSESKI